jgi:threonine/homoserine/homoserine lactone efflux protein
MDADLVAFAGVVTLLVISPGPDVALITNVALTDRRRTAFATSLGIGAGLFVHALASAVGISSLLVTSTPLFVTLRVAAAAYLVYLGIRGLWGSWGHMRRRGVANLVQEPATALGWRKAMGRGFMANVLNPKVSLFYLAMLPQFVAPDEYVIPRALLLATVHFSIGRAWHAILIGFISRIAKALSQARPWVELASGIALVAFGVVMALRIRA